MFWQKKGEKITNTRWFRTQDIAINQIFQRMCEMRMKSLEKTPDRSYDNWIWRTQNLSLWSWKIWNCALLWIGALSLKLHVKINWGWNIQTSRKHKYLLNIKKNRLLTDNIENFHISQLNTHKELSEFYILEMSLS